MIIGQSGSRASFAALLWSWPALGKIAMNRFLTVGLVVVAGAALFEAALIPGVVIGGAAVLAPKVLPTLRRRLRPLMNSTAARRSERAAAPPKPTDIRAPQSILPKFAFGQAIAKTITFRIIVTSLDFSVNYVVIGELGTAAGLSTFNMIAGPVFYLGHEAIWNYFGPEESPVDLASFTRQRADEAARQRGWRSIKISRALAKTITFRTVATVVDFTTMYVVIGDLATAAGLSAFGFVVGPFVYIGHEKAWERFSGPKNPQMSSPGLARPLIAVSPPPATIVAG
jgi:uncharacterized membrane protein